MVGEDSGDYEADREKRLRGRRPEPPPPLQAPDPLTGSGFHFSTYLPLARRSAAGGGRQRGRWRAMRAGDPVGEQEVIGYLQTLSNWGALGGRGRARHDQPDHAGQAPAAARLVRDGVSVTCARPIATDIAADTTFQPMRFMVDSGEGRDTASPERQLQRRGASEFIGMVFHGYTITHVDAPSHYFWDGQLYNGRSCNLVTSREGATVDSIEMLRDGVVSRGVLLDVARTRGGRGSRRRGRDAGGARGRGEGRGGPGGAGRHPARAHRLLRPPARGGAVSTAARPARPRSTSRAARGCASAAWRWSAPTPTTT